MPRFIPFVSAVFVTLALLVSPIMWLVTPGSFPQTQLFYAFLIAGGSIGISVRYILGVTKQTEVFSKKRAELQKWLDRLSKSDPGFEDIDRMSPDTTSCLQAFSELEGFQSTFNWSAVASLTAFILASLFAAIFFAAGLLTKLYLFAPLECFLVGVAFLVLAQGNILICSMLRVN